MLESLEWTERMINIHQRQPAPTLKVSPNLWVKLIQNYFPLSPHKSKKVQLLISFLIFLTQKPLNIKRRSRSRGGCPMGSSFPNHDAKVGIGQTEKRQEKKKKKKKKKNPRADCIRHN